MHINTKIPVIQMLMQYIVAFLIVAATGTFSSFGQSVSFQTYMNPVIPGDHADCTLTKVGNDYYTTGSSFNPTPVIYHSTDLVHWQAIGRPVSASWTGYGDTPGGGCWGGHMVYYNGQYWHFFSRANTMYHTKASDPSGPWSNPVRINNPSTLPYGLGYDNSIFIDDDNKWYLVVKNGQPNNGIVELNANGQPTGVVHNLAWLNPAPNYPFSWAEGPVMWKHNGYYYYAFARDLSGGQKVMRSKILTAEQSHWEYLGDFFNENDPQKNSSLFTSPNHVSPVVALPDSTYWVVHPLYAKGEWKGQGRQGLLNQVHYNDNDRPIADYPVNKAFIAPRLPSGGIPWMVPKSDFFDSAHLHPEWSWMGYTPESKTSLTDRPGWLRISPKSTTKPNRVVKNDGEHNYSLMTRLEFIPISQTDEAGLIIIRGDEQQQVKLSSTKNENGDRIVRFGYEAKQFETIDESDGITWLKMIRNNHTIYGYFSIDGLKWQQVGQGIDIPEIDSYSDFSTFTGTRQGLFSEGSKDAYFDFYIYRDAFSPIQAEWPANQLGNTKSSLGFGTYVLDQIHNHDWAMYAGVEFGDGTYYPKVDSVEFIASSVTEGGYIEVWIDSIDTGTKIAECQIRQTGSWSTLKSFTAAVGNVVGRHDVYLRFKGQDTYRLFMLDSFQFVSSTQTTGIPEVSNEMSTMTVYPNPTSGKLNIHAGFDFHTVDLYNLNGQKVHSITVEKSHNQELHPTLANGIYILKVTGDNQSAYRKVVIGN